MQFLQPSDLRSAYYDAQVIARKSQLKYDEFERLANNEVRSDLPANMPKVNDGSLAAAIRKVPKRIIAQPLIGKVKAVDRDEDWVAKIASVIWETRIIPNANTDAPFLSKWQTALKNALIYGSQPVYTFFTQHGTYTGADMSLPYVRNVYLEPGKVSDLASDFIFMDSWYTKLQAKRLLDKAIDDAAKVEEGLLEADDCMWDAKALQSWYDAGPSGKDSQNMTVAERNGINRNEKGYYKLTTCFNRGYQAPFYTFAPNMSDKVCGTQYNTNPTGDLPIIYLYADEDLINPYGTGLIQIGGATQNVLDNLTQSDVLLTQIGSQPPLDIHGDRTQSNLQSFQYAPRAFWFTGNASVTPVKAVDPAMYNDIPNRFSLYKAQLQGLTGTADNTIPAEQGATGQSKTPAGVHANQAMIGADDNFTQQRLAEAYQRVGKSMINIHMNNMEGSEMIRLEGDQLEFMATTDLVPTDENGEPAVDRIEVVWDNVRGSFDFEVDADSGMKSNDQEQATALQEAIQAISLPVSYYMAQDGYKFNIGEAYHSLFTKFGMENIDKIITKMNPDEKKAAQSAPFPIVDPPQLRFALADLPPEAVPAALQNAGISFDASHMSMPWKDQAAILAKETGVTNPMNPNAQTGQVGQPQAPGQQPSQPTDSQGNPIPQQNGQQVAAQFANPASSSPYFTEMNPGQQQGQDNEATEPQMQPSLPQRLMEIQEEWNVDPDTALTIASAQDHGATDDQIPQLLQLMAERGKQ